MYGPAEHAKVPAEVPENSQVLRVRHLCCRTPIASAPGSSPPERVGLDNMTSQPWSKATWPRTTSSSTLSCLFREKSVTIGSNAPDKVARGQVASDHG